jgi:tripartite ATP-independent transporter DctM subunit
MSVGLITVLIWSGLFVLLATGLPIVFCLIGLSVLGALVFVGSNTLYMIYPAIFGSLTNDVLLAIPLFVFMAGMLQSSGIGDRLYETMYKWMAGLRGGLAIGTVFICTLIDAMTGLTGTGTLVMGVLAYPEMIKRGYSKRLAIGCIPAAGCLGSLIPPSLPMILVGSMMGISIGKLFISGVIPGLMCSLFFAIYIAVKCFRNPSLGPPIPLEERSTWMEKGAALGGVLLPVILIIGVLGSIYSGICTPTEAGAVGAFGAILCALVYGNFTRNNLSAALIASLRITVMSMWLVLGGSCFSALLGITNITKFVGDILTSLPMSPVGVLLVMLAIVFAMGMFMDTASIILIYIPLMAPVAQRLGIDPLWFGTLFTLDLVIGTITPPFGYALFYFAGIGHQGVSMEDVYRSIIPYIPIMIGVLLLCIVFPSLILLLPSSMIR